MRSLCIVIHSWPSGHQALGPQDAEKSVCSIISCKASTKVSSGHNPSLSSGHPLRPVSGTTPSFRIRRIWRVEEHDMTWNWRFVANGQILPRVSLVRAINERCYAYFDETNERCLGILSEGSAPLSSNDVKLRVGSTTRMSVMGFIYDERRWY